MIKNNKEGVGLPCPHGRMPSGDVDGWKHCPHCLGINSIKTAPQTPLPERIEELLVNVLAEFQKYSEGERGVDAQTGLTDQDYFNAETPHFKNATQQINLLLAEVIDEVVGADIELRGDIDDKLLAFVPDMHQRSLEVTGVSSSFTNLYTRALVNQVLAQVRKRAKDMLGEK